MQAAIAKRQQEVLPRRPALTVGHLHAEDLAPAVPVDADRDQHCLAGDDAVLAHLLVASIEDQVGERFVEATAGKGGETIVEALVDRRDRRGREAVAAQLLGDRLDLHRRNALHVHLGQRRDERLLGALVAFEQLGREAAVTVLRDPQLELANPGDQRATVVARTIAHGSM
jgi:hypothetical protein